MALVSRLLRPSQWHGLPKAPMCRDYYALHMSRLISTTQMPFCLCTVMHAWYHVMPHGTLSHNSRMAKVLHFALHFCAHRARWLACKSIYRSKPKGLTDDPGVILCKSVRSPPFSTALLVTSIFAVCCLAALPWRYALRAFWCSPLGDYFPAQTVCYTESWRRKQHSRT